LQRLPLRSSRCKAAPNHQPNPNHKTNQISHSKWIKVRGHANHGISIERIIINRKKKADILKELDRVSINDSTMFPEIERAATYIKGKL
jgi:hypothetical protein